MPFPIEVVTLIAREHGFEPPFVPLPASGMVNDVWLLGGEHVLRIIQEPENDSEHARELAAVALARAAELKTPALMASGVAPEVGRPYTIYERVDGTLLGHQTEAPESFPRVYEELGRQIALMHSIEVPRHVVELLNPDREEDSLKQLALTFDRGILTSAERLEIEKWIDGAQQIGGSNSSPVLTHNDVHPWNVLVDDQGQLSALLDWGDTAYSDRCLDFCGMPLIVMPLMLDSYREAGGHVDSPMVARALLHGLALGLWEARDGSPEQYQRQCWRWPVGGWPEARERMDAILRDYGRA